MSVHINNQTFEAEYLKTPEDIRRGMMGRDSLTGCMVFNMGKGHHSFWMKNCITNLDIIFIDKGNITKIHHNCKPCNSDDCENFEGNGDMVLELRGGECKKYGIKEGDSIDIQS